MTLEQAMMAKRGSTDIAILLLQPGYLTPRKRPGTNCKGGRVGLRADLDGCGKSRPPQRDSILEPPSPQPVAIPYEISQPTVELKKCT
jgi:hypothetical protein